MEKLFPDAEDGSEFQFGYVHGGMVCHLTEWDSEPAVELIWEGSGEMGSTRTGWAVLKGDELHGRIFSIKKMNLASW